MRQIWIRRIQAAAQTAEGKLQHHHAGELKMIAQTPNLIGNEAQILHHNRQFAQFVPECVKKFIARSMHPAATHSSGGTGWDFPITLKCPKMVNTHHIHLVQRCLNALNPPSETGLFQSIPIVERIAPALAGLTEKIGWNTGDHGWSALMVQLKDLLIGPDINAVGGNKNGNIANNPDPLLVSILSQAGPLLEEVELPHLPNSNRLCPFFLPAGHRFPVA